MLDDAGATIISQAAALDLANQENEQLRSELENGNGTLILLSHLLLSTLGL